MLVRQMALEWGADGIRCNCVSPGPTVTGMTAKTLSTPEARARRAAAIPIGRVGVADDIAAAIQFLLSPAAQYITGVDLPVDGGLGATLMRVNAGVGLMQKIN
jgi:NAD(P)-dependent dehydrogenase (short-subunit alcohol dehydrogenase family)